MSTPARRPCPSAPHRRAFLQQAAGLAAGETALTRQAGAARQPAAQGTLPS
jgi:hypothetical protein